MSVLSVLESLMNGATEHAQFCVWLPAHGTLPWGPVMVESAASRQRWQPGFHRANMAGCSYHSPLHVDPRWLQFCTLAFEQRVSGHQRPGQRRFC